jgi:hypothetical protein
MVIHNVNSNSLWVEALKDNTSSNLILLAQKQALEQMKKAGNVPKTPSPGQPSISGIQEGHW